MNDIIKAFKKGRKIDGGSYYIFMVPSLSGGASGFMPFKNQFGFVKISGNPAHTIAHELGHGAFRLWHTFSTNKDAIYIAAQGATDNLMDYSNGTGLYKHQWDLLHDPERMLFPSSVDEDEQMMISYRFLKYLIESIRCAIYKDENYLDISEYTADAIDKSLPTSIYLYDRVKYGSIGVKRSHAGVGRIDVHQISVSGSKVTVGNLSDKTYIEFTLRDDKLFESEDFAEKFKNYLLQDYTSAANDAIKYWLSLSSSVLCTELQETSECLIRNLDNKSRLLLLGEMVTLDSPESKKTVRDLLTQIDVDNEYDFLLSLFYEPEIIDRVFSFLPEQKARIESIVYFGNIKFSNIQHIQAFQIANKIILEHGNTIFTSPKSDVVKSSVRNNLYAANETERAALYNLFAYYFCESAYYSTTSRTNYIEFVMMFDQLVHKDGVTLDELYSYILAYLYAVNEKRYQLDLFKTMMYSMTIQAATAVLPLEKIINPLIRPSSEIVLTNYKNFVKWAKTPINVAKESKILSIDELKIYLDNVTEATTVSELEEKGIRVFFRGTTRSANGSLFPGNPNAIANGISTSTDPIKATIFAIESATRNAGYKGVLQVSISTDLKMLKLVSPNRRIDLELEVVFNTSADNFARISKIEIPVEDARIFIKEIYGVDLPTHLERYEANHLLRTIKESSLEQSFEFYQKLLKR
jgi:hypothetical protein